jgi:hypothetical protein
MASDATSIQAFFTHCPRSASDYHLTCPAGVSGQFQITVFPHAGEALFKWSDTCHIKNPMRG